MPFAQHAPDRETERAMLAKVERYTATPALVSQIMWNNFAIDVRPILGLVRAPTLVAHCVDDPMVSVEFGRYLAENVPGAVYRELPGDFHVSWLVEHADMVVDAIEEFLFGAVAAPEPTERILTTVMFTDIVDSTPLARELGDARWRELLDRHDAIGREEIGRHRGREVKATGDGFLASFDGPARAVRCAQAIARRVRELGLRVRAGVHTGECELRGEDLSGIAVHVGARVAALADPNEVLATRTVRDLVAGSGIVFEDRGEHVLKGLGDPVSVFAAVPESRLL
jgi:class 3 adenylate cyclase